MREIPQTQNNEKPKCQVHTKHFATNQCQREGGHITTKKGQRERTTQTEKGGEQLLSTVKAPQYKGRRGRQHHPEGGEEEEERTTTQPEKERKQHPPPPHHKKSELNVELRTVHPHVAQVQGSHALEGARHLNRSCTVSHTRVRDTGTGHYCGIHISDLQFPVVSKYTDSTHP